MVLAAQLSLACAEPPRDPNIIIILADDLGYGDPQVYNPDSKIPTPHIDALAARGMRFTDAHSPSSVCSPTRYGLLTGRYAWRTELKSSVLWAWDRPLIAPDRLTLPKMLKRKQYATACIGKWHLGWWWPSRDGTGFANTSLPLGINRTAGRYDAWEQIDFSKPLGGGPLEAGFDYYFGDDVPNFPPYVFFENDRLLSSPGPLKPDSMFGSPGPMREGWRLDAVMPAITEKAVAYIHQEAEEDHPFFLYFSLTAPHTPIAPTDEFIGASEAGLYGDFVHEVDWSVGQLVHALEQTGALDNTLLIFTSDNGSPQRDGTGMNGAIASVKRYGHDPSKPWRGMKADIWEGGHRVPFIASWPNRIPVDMVSDQLISLTDIMASVSSSLGISPDGSSMEDSFDFAPVLLDTHDGGAIREDIVHHSLDGTFAVRKGEWKLILGRDSGGFSKNLPSEGIPVETNGQLYRLSDDPSEQENLYRHYPDIVSELAALLNQQKKSGRSTL